MLEEFFKRYLITDLGVQLNILRMWKDNYWITNAYPLGLTSDSLESEINYLSDFIFKIIESHEKDIEEKGGDPWLSKTFTC